jgi:hypothetical protein
MGAELTRDDLRAAVQEAVEQARESERQDSAERFAQHEADELELTQLQRRIKRIKVWAGAAVAVVTAVASVGAWVYARGQKAQADETREITQDAKIGTNANALDEHTKASDEAHKGQDNRIKNLGALQIEQGNDQRRILIKSAPKRVRAELEKKPDKLVEAEGAVLRD